MRRERPLSGLPSWNTGLRTVWRPSPEANSPSASLPAPCSTSRAWGYVPRSVPTENRTGLDITLEEDVKAIADVIVTALGLERNYADLTYSADKIKGNAAHERQVSRT